MMLVVLLFGVGVLLFTNPQLFIIITSLFSIIAFREYVIIYHLDKNRILYHITFISLTIACIGLLFSISREQEPKIILIAFIVLVTSLIILRAKGRSINDLVIAMSGLIYIFLFEYYLANLRLLPRGREICIVFGLGTAARDVITFIHGQLIKSGHPIIARINPQKTYEGAFSGLLVTSLFVTLIGLRLNSAEKLIDWIIVGIVIGIFGQIGDLLESWIKRSAKSRHSSHLLGEQGGILDQIDSLILTAPAVYYCVLILSIIRI
jgi:phosphatidate cytidylyltransferase